ncbi:hypothetical protein [Streptomyces sp. NPDC001980]|uniref:hypothetical protein n=1 Tax=Streptomyces sp. NPDC001980 TaxID=3157126 RepID=UPI003326E826
MKEAWLRGVAANPAAPPDVLLRLLDPAAEAAWEVLCEGRALPAEVVDAVIAHPDPKVRRRFARNPHAAPADRGRLATDPDAKVRAHLAGGPRPGRHPRQALPDDVLVTLLTARDEDFGPGQLVSTAEVAQELVASGQLPASFRHRAVRHENPAVRVYGAHHWIWLGPAQREALLADSDPTVREAARDAGRHLDPAAMEAELPAPDCHQRSLMLGEYAVSRAVVERCLAENRNLYSLARNRHTPADAVARLARDPDPEVRERVAARADLTPALLAELSEDPAPVVRTRALLQPLPRTWGQRAAIDRVIGRTAEQIGRLPTMLTEPDPGWYTECAISDHPLLRRLAATCPALPEDLAHRLAEDPDTEVRHLLALNHPLAPPATLLETFVAAPRQRPCLLSLPRLPRTGLARLLTHEDPEVRALAAADPTLDRPPVALLTDLDPRVRRAAAANPLIPPNLDDPDLAEGAAANSRLTAEQLHNLLDQCDLPPL